MVQYSQVFKKCFKTFNLLILRASGTTFASRSGCTGNLIEHQRGKKGRRN